MSERTPAELAAELRMFNHREAAEYIERQTVTLPEALRAHIDAGCIDAYSLRERLGLTHD